MMTKIKPTYQIGQVIPCPYCAGKGGSAVLLYYYVQCFFCYGRKQFKVETVLKVDHRNDHRVELSFIPQWGYHHNHVNKTEWISGPEK